MATDSSFPPVQAERSADGTYTIRSESGGELRVAAPGTKGAFGPSELLQAALAGCVALSADAQLASKLGPDFEATATVEALRHTDEDRIEKLIATVAADMSTLGDEERDKLLARTERIIDRLCGVKRSLNAGIDAGVTVQSLTPDV